MRIKEKIDNRIEGILSLLPNCETLADIGCDHGLTGFFALSKGKTIKVIATDISEPSLKKARNLSKKYELENDFDFRCGDGLSVLKREEADIILLSGIGGELMSDIILKGKDKIDKNTSLLLCPNNREAFLRETLEKIAFKITKERLIKENGKFYQVMLAESGEPEKLSSLEKEIGRKILSNKDDVLREYLLMRIKKNAKAIKSLGNAKSKNQRMDEFLKRQKDLKEVYEWFLKK